MFNLTTHGVERQALGVEPADLKAAIQALETAPGSWNPHTLDNADYVFIELTARNMARADDVESIVELQDALVYATQISPMRRQLGDYLSAWKTLHKTLESRRMQLGKLAQQSIEEDPPLVVSKLHVSDMLLKLSSNINRRLTATPRAQSELQVLGLVSEVRVTQLCGELERAGLISRTRVGNAKTITLTGKGMPYARKAHEAVRAPAIELPARHNLLAPPRQAIAA